MTPDLSAWTGAAPPERRTFEGRTVRLEPLDAARHADALWAAVEGHDAVWAWLAYGPFGAREDLARFVAELAAKEDIFFAVIDRASGRALGWMSLMEIRPAQGVIEVGHIMLTPAVQRTTAATEALFLLGTCVFEILGYRRFEWKCNDANGPSKRAALRFGFTPEGVFRQHMVVKGRNRDTAWFSLLDREWPQRRLAYARWLDPANFDAAGRQRVSLAALNAIDLPSGDLVGASLRRADRADVEALTALQQAAYEPNRAILQREPLPLRVEYDEVLSRYEVWLAETEGDLAGALILDPQPDHLLIWSVATAPSAQGRGLGARLLAAAEARARQLGLVTLRLYTGERLVQNIAWYGRQGYAQERIEALDDRRLVHMVKTIEG